MMQRQQQAPQTQLTRDPKNQVLCPACGGCFMTPRMIYYRVPGQVIGTVDLTFEQYNKCETCGELVNVVTAAVRKDVEKFESKPA